MLPRPGKPQTPVDLRAIVVRSHLDNFYSDPDSDIWQLAFWDNTKFETLKWFGEGNADFLLLNREQQLLVLVGNADGEIGNGGIGQLFFNRAGFVPAMQEAFAEMVAILQRVCSTWN